MVGGQMFDLEAEKMTLDIDGVTRLQQLKTGALITFACESGAILGRAEEPARRALRAYARDFGLACQHAADLLAAEGSDAVVRTRGCQDAAAGRAAGSG